MVNKRIKIKFKSLDKKSFVIGGTANISIQMKKHDKKLDTQIAEIAHEYLKAFNSTQHGIKVELVSPKKNHIKKK